MAKAIWSNLQRYKQIEKKTRRIWLDQPTSRHSKQKGIGNACPGGAQKRGSQEAEQYQGDAAETMIICFPQSNLEDILLILSIFKMLPHFESYIYCQSVRFTYKHVAST